GRGAHRPWDPDGLAHVSVPRRRRSPGQRHRDDEVRKLLLVGRLDREALGPECRHQHRRPTGRGRERLAACRIVHDADIWPAGHHQADRHAEERDAVGVIDGPVERIDHPHPSTARRRRFAGFGAVFAALLGEDAVIRVIRPDRIDDEVLRQVVGLGDDVARALVVDPLEAFVAIHQDLAGAGRQRDRELELRGLRTRVVDRSSRRRHGVRHSTWRSVGAVPNSVTVDVNVRVWCPPIRGVVTNEAVPMPPSPTRDSRHEDWPVESPWFVTVSVTARPPADGTTSPTRAGNGPLPAIDRRATTARMAIAPATAMNTEPWTCPDATSRRPSGLHSSQSPTPGGTGLPHRAQGWVGSMETGEGGADAVCVTHRWCHETLLDPAGRAPGRVSGHQRPTDSTSASTSSVVLAVTIAASAPAACQRSHAPRGSVTHCDPRTELSSPSQSRWKPTMTVWSS